MTAPNIRNGVHIIAETCGHRNWRPFRTVLEVKIHSRLLCRRAVKGVSSRHPAGWNASIR